MSQQNDNPENKTLNPDALLGILLDEKMRACDAASYLYTQEVERKLALEEGEKRGIDIGKIEVAKNLKAMGMSTEIIQKSTGLSKDQIEPL